VAEHGGMQTVADQGDGFGVERWFRHGRLPDGFVAQYANDSRRVEVALRGPPDSAGPSCFGRTFRIVVSRAQGHRDPVSFSPVGRVGFIAGTSGQIDDVLGPGRRPPSQDGLSPGVDFSN
ncbi:MAG: hypothetical protein KDJ88_07920, partial [Bauldia sp.]|nr:hypothetical protein [Bauldia sp.]